MTSKKKSPPKKEFISFDQYIRTYFPSRGKESFEPLSPYDVGVRVSKKVLSKLQKSLSNLNDHGSEE